MNIGENVDPQKPFPSLNRWISSISKNRERNKNVFMLRMGMYGKSSQTYQQIALKHAVPFIEYLNGFPLWQRAGMNIKDGLVYIESDRNI